MQAAQNQKQTNTAGLAKFLKLKTGAKVMLTVNTDIQDCPINVHPGIIRHTEFSQAGARKAYVKFPDK